MSVEATRWVWDHSTTNGNDLVVLLKIADNANADGGGAYPGIDYLARKCRISRRAVYDCLRRLKASGELVEEEHGGGRGRKTIYRVLMATTWNDADLAPYAEQENGAEPALIGGGNGAASHSETVQPAARNGADSGGALIRKRTTLNHPENQPPLPPHDPILDIWETWRTSTGRQRAQLDDNRRRAIQKALSTYPVDDVLDAVRGWVNDPWPERAQQNDICQLLHTGTARKPLNVLEKMRDLWRDGPPTTAGRQTQELARNANGLSRAFQAMEGGNGGDPRVGTARAPAQRELPRPAGRAVHSR